MRSFLAAVFFQGTVFFSFTATGAAAREYAEKGYRTKTVVGGFLAYQGRETESFR